MGSEKQETPAECTVIAQGAAPAAWLESVEIELRKVPGLDERDIEVLTAMASAGFDYAAALKQREAKECRA